MLLLFVHILNPLKHPARQSVERLVSGFSAHLQTVKLDRTPLNFCRKAQEVLFLFYFPAFEQKATETEPRRRISSRSSSTKYEHRIHDVSAKRWAEIDSPSESDRSLFLMGDPPPHTHTHTSVQPQLLGCRPNAMFTPQRTTVGELLAN